MEPVSLYQWVNDNNPPEERQYGKGWWDHVEFLFHLDEVYGRNKTTVVSTYHMTTPPPKEVLLMPIVRLETGAATVIMKYRFDLIIEPKWTVSVIRDGVQPVALYGLIDEQETVSPVGGFATEWMFPSYATSPSRFTARIEDDWQLYAFAWIVAHS